MLQTQKLQASSVIVSLIAGTVLTVGGCRQLNQIGVGTTSIDQVIRNPSQYPQVVIRGQVVNQVSVLGEIAYQLEDDSGSIWVITKTGTSPAANATLTVKGRFTRNASFAGGSVDLAIAEQERF